MTPPDLSAIQALYEKATGLGSKWAVSKREDGTAQVYATSVGPMRMCAPVAETMVGDGEYISLLHNSWPAIRAALDRQSAALERLPKTADGVPITPNMKVWVIPLAGKSAGVPSEATVEFIHSDALNGQPEKLHVYIDLDPYYGGYTPERLTFSTKEAADAFAVANPEMISSLVAGYAKEAAALSPAAPVDGKEGR